MNEEEKEKPLPDLFGLDICPECKEEIPREEGLKHKCPKCGNVLRNPIGY